MKGLEDVDVWKNSIQQDVNDLKTNQSQIKTDIHKLQMSDQLQNQEISTLKDALNRIQEDTTWIRRMITKAIISALITGVIGGVVAFFFTKFY